MPGLRRVLVAAIVLLTLFSPMARAADLAYTLGPQGLASLSYRGQARLGDGRLQVVNTTPRFGRADAPQGGETPTATRFDAKGRMLTQTYPWGRLVGIYDQRGDSLTLRLTVRNDTPDTLTALDVQVAELTFPSVPQGDTADPGMFGTGGPHPLEYPLSADPRNTPPVLLIDDGTGGVLDFASEGVTDPVTVSVPFSTNPPTRTRYPFWASVGNIAPGASRTFTVALRFGPPGASPVALARDLYKKYAAAYPFRVHWTDRRPIGTDFLATSEAHPAKNPRGWFLNAADADTTTAEGRAAFRRRLMDYADA
ncbi:MAG: hypothetical protein JO250_11555, partial [Armatimonadetes bacterium]|nr:hypothetical protein [Armatimonadota bacterium]